MVVDAWKAVNFAQLKPVLSPFCGETTPLGPPSQSLQGFGRSWEAAEEQEKEEEEEEKKEEERERERDQKGVSQFSTNLPKCGRRGVY